MSDPIFFSIVVPTYNRAHLIPATIEGIIAQTYKHFEVIIVDDGSTDNTEEVIQKFLSDNVRYYKKENAERAAARNFGTMKANGDYINWFDSDDIMFPGNLSAAVETIIKYNRPEVLVMGYNVYDASGKALPSTDFAENVNLGLYRGNPWGNSPVIVRKDIALAYPYNEDRELSGSEDYELWLRLASRYQFYTSPPKTVGYVFHNDNSTLTMNDADQLIRRFTKFIHYTTSDQSIVAFLGKNKSYFIMKNYLLLAVDLVVSKQKKPGLKYLAKSFSNSALLIFEKGFFAFIKHFFGFTNHTRYNG